MLNVEVHDNIFWKRRVWIVWKGCQEKAKKKHGTMAKICKVVYEQTKRPLDVLRTDESKVEMFGCDAQRHVVQKPNSSINTSYQLSNSHGGVMI